jgi:hypothetical protein
MASAKQLLECLLCERQFSHADIVEGRYWIETLICSQCYAEMQSKPHQLHCFGKPTMMNFNSLKPLLGYSPQAKECRQLCPDRNICAHIIQGKRKNELEA